MKLVIVESPAKAKTINKYLGSDYKVLASFGHIRDLPSKDGSVNPDEDFAMTWELSPGGKKRLNDIIAAVKDADTIVLASDPDREGEAIAWHILEELTARKKIKDKKIERVVFHEITKSAVTEAIKNPRRPAGSGLCRPARCPRCPGGCRPAHWGRSWSPGRSSSR